MGAFRRLEADQYRRRARRYFTGDIDSRKMRKESSYRPDREFYFVRRSPGRHIQWRGRSRLGPTISLGTSRVRMRTIVCWVIDLLAILRSRLRSVALRSLGP